LKERNVDFNRIAAVIGRGGLIKPVESGVYLVNDRMKEDLFKGVSGQHASNLGGLIAGDIAALLPNASAYIVDPVVVDELQPVARLSGLPEIERISIFHALNQKSVARKYAASEGRQYESMNLVIAHMGGGISVGAHNKGRVIDVNNALDGDGPFSPERSGGLPAGQLTDLCFSGKFNKSEIKKMINGRGGMVAYLGTNDFIEVCNMADGGNDKALLVRDAAAYQVAKEIGSMAAVLKGEIDAIILTGGLSYSGQFVEIVKSMISFLAPVVIYPGEDEIGALAFNGLLALDGKIAVKTYS
jgi:butyrate kinase